MTAVAARPPVSQRALAIGRRLARKVFQKRGDRSEAHVSEAELAALFALAAALGAREREPE